MTAAHIRFGGDYNPEQWPRATWHEDVSLMRHAAVNTATVAVFSWSAIEPTPGKYEFEWLDDVLDLLHSRGIRVILATATASPPAWLAQMHPESLPVTDDGVRLGFGSRQQYSPSSLAYREAAARLVRQLAQRYADHPSIDLWHIGNEYGGHNARSYDQETADAFRRWLERKYESIAALNAAWGTAFWSQQYRAFDEVDVPRRAPFTINPTQLIDFDRFSSDALLELFLMEKAIIREYSALPVTTNFMGMFKDVDYWSWAPHIDIISDDLYPDPADPLSYILAAATRDAMRSFKGGQPWLLMEQATSAVNWRARNVPKPPGLNRLHALQCVARGADGVLHFQWRQSVAGAEKFHSAMLPHSGADSRVFRETAQLGHELQGLAHLAGEEVPSQIAIVLDWDSWRAIEQDAVPARGDYHATILEWYAGFLRRGLTVDFVHPEADTSSYRLVVAPLVHVMTAAANSSLAAVATRGDVLVVGCRSGVLDENLHAYAGGYLGGHGSPLQAALGICIEEFAPTESAGQPVALTGISATAHDWQELVVVEDAQVLSRFADGFAAGRAALTQRGTAFYLATEPGEAIDELADKWLKAAAITPIFAEPLTGLETVERGSHRWTANHTPITQAVLIDGVEVTLPPFDSLWTVARSSSADVKQPRLRLQTAAPVDSLPRGGIREET